jgi:hypothetical protein
MTAVLVKGPITVKKWAVCWLDVLLFAIFVTASLALWTALDRRVTEQHRELKPAKEDFEHRQKVPTLQTALAMAQDELKTLNSKLVELRMEETRLAADLLPTARRPLVRLLSPQREQRIKLLKTQAMARAYEAQIPKEMRQLATAASAVFQAKHSAEIDYNKALKDFRFANKIRVLKIVSLDWVILALSIWVLCGVLRRWLGHGRTLHVLVPGMLIMATALIYYFVT